LGQRQQTSILDVQCAIGRIHDNCLVVTDGFSEWKKLDPKGKTKQAYAVDMASTDQMVMAGLWSRWRDPANGEEVLSSTVLTCEPNRAMVEIQFPSSWMKAAL
jgi:putative SOS response-associated peptidase YedK